MAAIKHRRRKHRNADTFVRVNSRLGRRRGLTLLGFRHALRTRASALRAFTLVEVLAIIGVIAILVFLLLPALAKAREKQRQTDCVINLKNIGLACRIFGPNGEYPWQLEAGTNFDGTMGFTKDPTAMWRHFAAISNELSQPKLVFCPSDRERRPARAWAEFTNNGFISYALGLSASEEQPQSILATDRNLTLDGVALSNTIVTFPINANVAFDGRIHRFVGNMLLGDGSVQQVTSGRLRDQFRDAFQAVGTNTLVIP